MRSIKTSKKYEKSRKRLSKRGKDLAILDSMIEILANRNLTSVEIKKYNDHPLKGNYAGYRELHLINAVSDWLLIYRIIGNSIEIDDTILELNNTGSHSDLYGSADLICL